MKIIKFIPFNYAVPCQKKKKSKIKLKNEKWLQLLYLRLVSL